MIELIGAGKDYPTPQGGAVPALKNINLHIREGEFLGIAGKNASGKTTLARLLNGLLLPTRGRVMVSGMDTRSRQYRMEIRRKVAMVFQNPENQIVNPVVEEEIAFGPENLNLPAGEVRRRVDEVLELLQLTEFRKHAPHLLSGGQKQRVAIASALAMQPDVLVLDEPTSMLDAWCRKDLMTYLLTLNRRRGMTAVLITHSMEDLAEADRLVVMDEGKIISDTPPWEVFGRDSLPGMLRPPDISRLVRQLNERGGGIDPRITVRRELVDALCR